MHELLTGKLYIGADDKMRNIWSRRLQSLGFCMCVLDAEQSWSMHVGNDNPV